MNIYETDKLLAEYLLFHYGEDAEVLPYAFGPREALGYAARCVSECVDAASLPSNARALDLGCAVGRSSFELARYCAEVIGIDYSRRFIAAAEKIRTEGEIPCLRADEGALTTESRAVVPREIDRRRVRFEVGDAMDLRTDLGRFDVVLMANLIDRLSEPRRCLARLPALVNKEFTPRDAWLGGFERGGQRISTREGLIAELSAGFSLVAVRDLPLLIREHARKFQWSVAEATIWRRKSLETNARP